MTNKRDNAENLADEACRHKITADINGPGLAVILADKCYRYSLALSGNTRQPYLRTAAFDQRVTPSKGSALAFQQSDKPGRAKHGKSAHGPRRLDNTEVGDADIGIKIRIAINETGLQHHLARANCVGDAKSLQRAATIIRRHDKLREFISGGRIADRCLRPADKPDTFQNVPVLTELDVSLRFGNKWPILVEQISGKLRFTTTNSTLRPADLATERNTVTSNDAFRKKGERNGPASPKAAVPAQWHQIDQGGVTFDLPAICLAGADRHVLNIIARPDQIAEPGFTNAKQPEFGTPGLRSP